jgi:hypothetical protein
MRNFVGLFILALVFMLGCTEGPSGHDDSRPKDAAGMTLSDGMQNIDMGMNVDAMTVLQDSGVNPNDSDSGGQMPSPIISIAVGHRWTYRITSSSGVITTKIQTIIDEVMVAGETAYVFETARANNRGTRSIQRLVDNRLVRLSEETLDMNMVTGRFRFSPPGLRVDGNYTTTGDSYTDIHDKVELDAQDNVIATVTKNHSFEVESSMALVTVPAGQFEAIRVRRDRAGGTSKTYWFVPGIGKVKEIGGQTEELMSAELGN